jgi:hypothetical protein
MNQGRKTKMKTSIINKLAALLSVSGAGLFATLFEIGWKQLAQVQFQRLRQHIKLGIVDAANAGFNFCQCAAGDFNSAHRAARGQGFLSPIPFVTQTPDSAADHIKFMLHSGA